MQLTTTQEKFKHQLTGILSRQHARVILNGAAGTGKTTLVNALVDHLENAGLWVMRTAPTHKAASHINGSTIQSLLGGRLQYDDEGVAKFTYSGTSDPFDVLVVDEASMLSTELLEILNDGEKFPPASILFVGDSNQLPPVGENTSPVFTRDYETLTLTEQLRHGDAVGDFVAGSLTVKMDTDAIAALAAQHGIEIIDDPKLVEEETTFIAFTNREVVRAGRRKKFDLTQSGQMALVNEAANDLPNNSLVTVSAYLGDSVVAYDTKARERVTVPVYMLRLTNGMTVKAIKDFTQHKSIPAKIRSTVCDLREPRSLTAHKAQGSTIADVAVFVTDIMEADQQIRRKLFYTAVSRASKRLQLIITTPRDAFADL